MISIDSLTCPSCKTKIFEELQPDNAEIFKTSFDDSFLSFKCYKCKHIITAKPNVRVSYDDIE